MLSFPAIKTADAIVVPLGTVTLRPSIVRVTVSFMVMNRDTAHQS